MILSGREIHANLGAAIRIDPFDESALNPNSYNLRLHDELLVYEEAVLDMKRENRVRRLQIPSEGVVLEPNQLYLGRTIEYTETHGFVPMIEGRSSVGRLGMCIHVTAGIGDVGFCGCWTLEIFVLHSIRIYPGVAICQIFFQTVSEDHDVYASDKYQHNHDIQPSLIHRELSGGERSAPRPMLEH